MALQIFSKIDQQLADPISQFVTDGVSNLASAVSGPLKAAVTLWIIFQGISILRGVVNEPVMDFAVKAMKVVVIVALATKVDTYNAFIKNVFFEALPREIGNALAGSGATTPTANAFDSFLQKGYQSAQELWSQSGMTNPGPAFLGVMVMVIAGLGAVVAYTVSLYAKIALAVVLALGPVFVALALFRSTKRFTESWLGQVVNFVVLQALVMVVLSLVLKVADQLSSTAASGNFGDAMMSALTMSVVYLLAAFVSFQLPSIASAIAGGGAALGLGLAQSAVLAMGKAELPTGSPAKDRAAAHRAGLAASAAQEQRNQTGSA